MVDQNLVITGEDWPESPIEGQMFVNIRENKVYVRAKDRWLELAYQENALEPTQVRVAQNENSVFVLPRAARERQEELIRNPPEPSPEPELAPQEVAIGTNVAQSNENVFIGYEAEMATTTGDNNVAIGYNALASAAPQPRLRPAPVQPPKPKPKRQRKLLDNSRPLDL